MKSFESPTPHHGESEASEKEVLPGDIVLPHAEAAIELYQKQYPNNPERVEKLKEIFQIFVEQGIANTEIFTSKEVGASFPWTVIRMQELAKALYEKNATLPASDPSQASGEKSDHTFAQRQEFIFGSGFAPEHGDEFVFAEEAMHQVIKKIPQAIEDLKAGKEPENFQVYMAGMPTNLLGKVSQEFADNLKKDPYEYMGRLYADLVAQQSATSVDGRKAIELYGISMGGGFAVKVGEKLLEKGIATQDYDNAEAKSEKPVLQIKAMVPVSMGEKENKNWQIMAGFAADGVITMATNPGVKIIGKGIPEFQKKVNTLLAKRGIHKNMDEEQKTLKGKAIRSIVMGLGKSLDIDPSVHITKVVGLQDLTMYTPSFNKEAQEHREENFEETEGQGSLGTQLVPRKNPNQRVFGVNMRHALPFFRDSEFKRMDSAAEAIEKIKKSD